MMSNKKRNRRRNRSEVSSASSCEERSPAAKRPASTESNAMSSNTPAIMAAVEEEPSISQIWQVLIKIQADVTKILSDNQELRKDVESLKTSMQCHATEVDALKTQNRKLVQSNCALQSEPNELGRRLQALEYEHDALEQYTRKFNVEIHGVLEYEGENLQDIVMKIGLKMSLDVTTQDIDIVHRYRLFRKSQAIKSIRVRFTSYKKRREFYKGRFHLKETNITEITGIAQGYADGRIFVNKNLTQYRQEVLAKERKMKKANKIFRVWTVDGKIFVQKTEDSRPVRISEIWELDEPAT